MIAGPVSRSPYDEANNTDGDGRGAVAGGVVVVVEFLTKARMEL